MTNDEHNAVLEQLRTCTDEAERMSLIVNLQQDYTGVLTERENAVTTAEEQKATASKYAALNNEFWLASSNQKNNTQTKSNINDNEQSAEPPKKISFADLEAKILNDYKGGK